MDIAIIKQLIIVIVLGFMIGLQRELSFYHSNKETFMGARTFSLISMTGFLGAVLYRTYPELLMILAFLVGAFLLIFYAASIFKDKESRGVTSEFGAVITFIIGILVGFEGDYEFAVFVTIIVVAIFEIKPKLLSIKAEITEKDTRASILFLLMTFVVLPILPDNAIDPYGIINPHKIWLMVILISGLSFLGYIATRFLDTSKGLIIMGIFGGFASSTAVALTLSKKATRSKEGNKSLAIAIALASSTMFIRVVIWTFATSKEVFKVVVIPYSLTTIVGYIIIYYFYRHTNYKEVAEEIEFKNPLEFVEALKMGVIFGLIFGLLSVVQEYFGSFGVYVASFVSGFTDIDAITLSLGQLADSGKLAVITSVIGIVLASVTNTVTKLLIVYSTGNKSLGMYVGGIFLSLLTVLAISFISLAIFL